MHSQPDLADNAYWKGAVALSTAGPNCCAIVRETNLQNTSPVTMPLTPSVGFINDVTLS